MGQSYTYVCQSVDLHPTEPWMLASLSDGSVRIWDCVSQELISSVKVSRLPVRAARFVPRKNWVVAGSDDTCIQVFNCDTPEIMWTIRSRSGCVRCITVHPTQPFILTSGDDNSIKLWNWDRNWACQWVFEGHTRSVMQIVISPKDDDMFATASFDNSVKVWQLGSSTPKLTLEGHKGGVTCVDYAQLVDKPYLISGAGDGLMRIWDYKNKTCVQTMKCHTHAISCVAFLPGLQIIMTGSEDATVRVWNWNEDKYCVGENRFEFSLGSVRSICCLPGSNNIALGFVHGSLVIPLSCQELALSGGRTDGVARVPLADKQDKMIPVVLAKDKGFELRKKQEKVHKLRMREDAASKSREEFLNDRARECKKRNEANAKAVRERRERAN